MKEIWKELIKAFWQIDEDTRTLVLKALGTHPGGDLPMQIQRQAFYQARSKHGVQGVLDIFCQTLGEPQ